MLNLGYTSTQHLHFEGGTNFNPSAKQERSKKLELSKDNLKK